MSFVSTDPIADMLTRIRNASSVGKHEVSLPHSKVRQAIAELLKANGFINSVNVAPGKVGKTLELTLNTLTGTRASITEIERISKPGRRTYVRHGEIPVVKRGRGMVIISTSRGMMSGAQAKTAGLGGELICKVY